MIGTIERKITLELNGTGVQVRLPARQGDSLVYRISVGLTWNGRVCFPEGAVWAEVRATLPDGRIVSSDCMIENERCIFIPGAEFFLCGGPVLCRLILRGDDGGELCSPAFAMDAEPSTAVAESVMDAEAYSRLAEILSEVMKAKTSLGAEINEKLSAVTEEIEEKLEKLGTINDVKQTVDSRDFVPVYSTADKRYVRISWMNFRQILRTHVDGNIAANSIVDPDTGYTAVLPELEDDCEIALRSDLEDIADTLPAETWTFELEDGTVVTKQVIVR